MAGIAPGGEHVYTLAKTIGQELAHLKARVNAVCPGHLVIPMSMEIDSLNLPSPSWTDTSP